MRFAISLLGCEVLSIDTTSGASQDGGPGDVTTVATAVGFTNVYAGHSEEDR